MTNCNDKTYKFTKGVQINTDTFIGDEIIEIYSTFKLLITDIDGTTVAIVDPDYAQYKIYSEFDNNDNLFYHESLVSDDFLYYISEESISLTFKDGKFTINSGNDTYDDIGIDKMDLTSYGQEVLGECFENTTKYDAPTFNDHDHSSDYPTSDNPSEVQYSPMMDTAIF